MLHHHRQPPPTLTAMHLLRDRRGGPSTSAERGVRRVRRERVCWRERVCRAVPPPHLQHVACKSCTSSFGFSADGLCLSC